ncbi:50S ribosomal protein L32 [Candidatus Curtissbacteria bacterium RIFCSPLOWO2_02_41_11]|uniref:Large ribosomal subunit protein bL32 n=1 Tax=Candidatus Curtissbacteria bacterium RIFCSPLOWO2_02_41_11 TaxID=1797731 RepID=A0A1F5HSR7_9BACT|nr:MAG: 50S ribosomal protein L32 [Candidatus Curtissbacteria bacterium RIFCSPHIGHO2_02_39_8]OGE07192.1 MAG: 50S ribosomal protein L32 [Candidatus Curtissbacteria bacterium RIFCSPLOWO2_02_41_11]
MAPLPKKKHAKARTKTRKAAINLSLPHLVTCSKCQNLKLPHRVCPTCGFYKEGVALKMANEKKK